MSLVATLITDPANPILDGHVVERARAALLAPQHAIALAPGVAVDIRFAADTVPEAAGARSIEARLREAVSGLPIDVVVQEAGGRAQASFPRRHGFDHDRAGMHRRTR